MSIPVSVRRQFKNFLDGHFTLEVFEDFFVQVTWGRMPKDGPLSLIDLYFAEYTSGHRTKEELVSLIRNLLDL